MLTDEKCPICGTVNKNLDLNETDGWFECEKCKNSVKNLHNVKKVKVPLFDMTDVAGIKRYLGIK